MTAYYSEFEPYAAQWLRNLINAGLIAPGDVDERDLNDVHPDDLRPYTQVHLCAGIGVWSRALRNIGWPDDARIWSASFPCQPFSAAGKGVGFADERHLWPTGYHLITHLRPERIVGEQVASKDGLAWLDLVQTDLERAAYAFGAVDTCSAGFGAPHIRQRLYWVADAEGAGGWQDAGAVRGGKASGLRSPQGQDGRWPGEQARWIGDSVATSWLGDGDQSGLEGLRDAGGLGHSGKSGFPEQRSIGGIPSTAAGTPAREAFERTGASISGLADNAPGGRGEERSNAGGEPIGDRAEGQPARLGDDRRNSWPGPTNGLWGDVDWLHCRDEKWRPVEPGTFPLAHAWALGNRVGMLRAAGNALNIAQAEAFLAACLT